MKKLTVLGLAISLAGISGCETETSSSSSSADPSNDSLWTQQTGGVASSYPEYHYEIPDGEYTARPSTVTCTAIDADGDSATDDGSLVQLEWTSATVAVAKATVFLDNATCTGGYLGYDYADQIEVTYTVSSASFDFNRIDMIITDASRHVQSVNAMNTLNNGAGACGKNDWASSTTYSHFTDITCNGTANTMNGIHNPKNIPATAVGDKIEGVYISFGDLISIEVDAEGSRPTGSDIASFNATNTGLTGTNLYSRQ